ncbi:MAG: hypothetical protein GWP08_05785 [Nitrospiraceae bacterium]|nr:hypothetical protein [Nitrospiraceae bacterium]
MDGEQEVRISGDGGASGNDADAGGVNGAALHEVRAAAAAFSAASDRALNYANQSTVSTKQTLEAIRNTGGE